MDKIGRPLVLGGITVKVVTGCGNMYIQMNWYHGQLLEVFATLGHSGGCAACEMEALTRSVTVGLKYGVPLSEYVHQFKGTHCPNPIPFPKESAVMSCPDAIARSLEQYGSLSIDRVVDLLHSSNGDGACAVAGAPVPLGTELSDDEVAEKIQELAQAREEQGI